jgi:hypothetical protein
MLRAYSRYSGHDSDSASMPYGFAACITLEYLKVSGGPMRQRFQLLCEPASSQFDQRDIFRVNGVFLQCFYFSFFVVRIENDGHSVVDGEVTAFWESLSGSSKCPPILNRLDKS